MNLSARTFYDEKRLIRFSVFVGLHRIGLWICLLAVTALVTVPFIFQFTGMGVDWRIILGFVVVLIIDFFYLFTYFVLPRSTVNKMPLLGVTIDFLFLDTIFIMTASGKKGEEKSTFKYIDLNRVKESSDKKEIYLYITKSQAFIVDTSKLGADKHTALKEHIIKVMNGKRTTKSK